MLDVSIYYIIIFFILGTIMGSFYNVVGYRLPKNMSIVTPPSSCPNCGKRLTFIELIPIISYIIQGGKCRHHHLFLILSQ
jgi:leader peptidase (prepilin peptidase)/N-methyltransferase